MKKVAFVFGTRPEAIKLAPVILAMRRQGGLATHLCATAQHRELLDQVFEVFDIRPDADLGLMRPDQSLAGLTARAVTALDDYYRRERPDLVLVQGDTTTVLCAALTAFYRRIPVGHVEAGLRTGDKFSPFPEEINRVLTTHVADLHFAPTSTARANLLAEGVAGERIFVTGNPVIDALRLVVPRTRREPPAIPGLPGDAPGDPEGRPLVLITGHRRESFGPPFESLCRAIARLAGEFADHAFVYPVHLNPRVREPVFRLLGGRANVHLIEPVSYLAFVALMDRSKLILTDSGGVQEEAPSLGKPVLVMREATERPEAVAAGAARLVGTDFDRIVTEAKHLLTDPAAYRAMAQAVNPYGDGQAGGRIVEVCLRFLAAGDGA